MIGHQHRNRALLVGAILTRKPALAPRNVSLWKAKAVEEAARDARRERALRRVMQRYGWVA